MEQLSDSLGQSREPKNGKKSLEYDQPSYKIKSGNHADVNDAMEEEEK